MNTHATTHTGTNTTAAAHPTQRRVTDDVTRTFHWLFALSFLGAYVTADSDSALVLHMGLGYLMIGLLAFRVIWGLVGPKRARLTSLFGRMATIRTWIATHKGRADIWQFNWQTAQNALMTWIIAMLLITTIPLVLSGYLTQADVISSLMEDFHEFLGEFYLALVITHLAAIAIISVWRRRNLALPIISGYAPGKGPDIVKHTYTWLAALLLLAAVSWIVYFVVA